jgi:crossover junction endodeoxyribonuclease RuvC
MSYPKCILGIDPGSLHTGWGAISIDRRNRLSCRDYGVIDLSSHRSLGIRLQILWQDLNEIISHQRPQLIGIESLFHHRNAQSALKLGHARGVALLAAVEADCQIEEISPAQVKQASVGYGRATKEQVQLMIKKLLALGEAPPADAADALAIAISITSRLSHPKRLG